jgi:ribosome biogenesis GTPase A
LKKNKLLKGGFPDTETAARLFLWDYQKGKISLE